MPFRGVSRLPVPLRYWPGTLEPVERRRSSCCRASRPPARSGRAPWPRQAVAGPRSAAAVIRNAVATLPSSVRRAVRRVSTGARLLPAAGGRPLGVPSRRAISARLCGSAGFSGGSGFTHVGSPGSANVFPPPDASSCTKRRPEARSSLPLRSAQETPARNLAGSVLARWPFQRHCTGTPVTVAHRWVYRLPTATTPGGPRTTLTIPIDTGAPHRDEPVNCRIRTTAHGGGRP
jgi:hypothetical protein